MPFQHVSLARLDELLRSTPSHLKPDDNVVIVGTGGLGLMAIQVVKSLTGARLIAIDIDDHKLQVAKENGAEEVINSKTDDPVKGVIIVKQLTVI